MRKLEDLKKDLLQDKLDKFYVFYGEDFGIRKHYIQKIATYFSTEPRYIDDFNAIKVSGRTKSLFGPTEELVVIYDDEEFAKQPEREIQKFIDNLRQYTCIFVYEEPLESSNLFKHFDQYITNFPVVQDNIGIEFVKSEVDLGSSDTEKLAHNCYNNYSNILLESDKIKEYSQAKNVSNQVAYETLDIKNQLLDRIDKFNVNEFMDDVLMGNSRNLAYWYVVVKADIDKFIYSLVPMFNDFLIAALVKEHGKYDGSSLAYEFKLNWGRAKTIREMNIVYNHKYLFECAYKVACIDSDIKSGRLEREKVIDYFYSSII